MPRRTTSAAAVALLALLLVVKSAWVACARQASAADSSARVVAVTGPALHELAQRVWTTRDGPAAQLDQCPGADRRWLPLAGHLGGPGPLQRPRVPAVRSRAAAAAGGCRHAQPARRLRGRAVGRRRAWRPAALPPAAEWTRLEPAGPSSTPCCSTAPGVSGSVRKAAACCASTPTAVAIAMAAPKACWATACSSWSWIRPGACSPARPVDWCASRASTPSRSAIREAGGNPAVLGLNTRPQGRILLSTARGAFRTRTVPTMPGLRGTASPAQRARRVPHGRRRPDGALWIGLAVDGLAAARRRAADLGTAEGLPNSRVLSLLLDQDGALWTATNGGLMRLGAAPFST
jgi:hypothetical protein